jgi:hypothetical protein
MFDPANFFGGLLTGGAAGSVITAVWNGCRDKNRRRIDFLAFLRGWRSDVVAYQMRQLGSIWEIVPAVFTPNLRPLHTAVTKVEDDVSDKQTFRRLTDRLAGLSDKDWNAQNQPREVILEAIDELIKFLA